MVAIARAIRQHLHLTMFNFDVVVQAGTSTHPRVVVVDVNYLPSYEAIPNRFAVVLRHIVRQVAQHRHQQLDAGSAVVAAAAAGSAGGWEALLAGVTAAHAVPSEQLAMWAGEHGVQVDKAFAPCHEAVWTHARSFARLQLRSEVAAQVLAEEAGTVCNDAAPASPGASTPCCAATAPRAVSSVSVVTLVAVAAMLSVAWFRSRG